MKVKLKDLIMEELEDAKNENSEKEIDNFTSLVNLQEYLLEDNDLKMKPKKIELESLSLLDISDASGESENDDHIPKNIDELKLKLNAQKIAKKITKNNYLISLASLTIDNVTRPRKNNTRVLARFSNSLT